MTNPVIPEAALEAAKEAMREVTPPAGVTKADWLAKYGEWALLAGAISAALEAADPRTLAGFTHAPFVGIDPGYPTGGNAGSTT